MVFSRAAATSSDEYWHSYPLKAQEAQKAQVAERFRGLERFDGRSRWSHVRRNGKIGLAGRGHHLIRQRSEVTAMSRNRQQLAMLSIPPGASQRPVYSPVVQTAVHQGFPPPFPQPSLFQTPLQPSFFPPPSPLPPRPLHPGHRSQASVALAAAGIHPPPGVPATPLAQSQFPPAAFGPPQFPPFQPRSRRQPSISTGGPPKAQLGGVGKNYRPPSPTAAVVNATAAQNQKLKKTIVNLPKESVPGVDGEPSTRSSFARTPIPPHLVPPHPLPSSPDVISAVINPPDRLRETLPDTIDVFLPGKVMLLFALLSFSPKQFIL